MHIPSLSFTTQHTSRGRAVQRLIPTLLTKTAIAVGLLALAACGGGGDGTSATPAPMQVLGAGGQPGMHLAALGPLAGAKVTVAPLLQPENVLVSSTTSATGTFALNTSNLPAEFDSQLLKISVFGGNDTDVNDDGVPEANPTPNTGTISALVKGSDLKTRSIAVTLLSEAIYRAVEGQMDTVPQEAIERSMEEIAYQLFDQDLDGDSFISYGDVLSFNPTRPRDKTLLSFPYADFLKLQDDGTSVVTKFHTNNMEAIPLGISTVLGARTLSRLPDQLETGLVIVNISSGNGGVVVSPDIPTLDLGSGNRTFVHKMARKTATNNGGKVTFRATAEDGFTFARWVGCDAPAIAMGDTCVVQNAEDNFAVSAQFMLNENKLVAGLTNQVALGDAPGKLGVVLSGNNTLTLTALMNDAASKAKIDSVRSGSLIHTGLITFPQVKVIEDLGEAPVVSTGNTPDFYRKQFRYESIELFDAFEQATYLEDDRPIELDDLTAVRYAPEVNEAQKTIVLPTRANRSFIEGPTPSGQSGAQGSCEVATDEEIYATIRNGNSDEEVVIACIEEGAEPDESAESCQAPQEDVLTTVDGRVYCIPANNQLAANSKRSKDDTPLRVLAKEQTGNKTGMVKAREIILAGYGRAFDLGDNVYLTSNPNKPGLLMIEAEGDLKPATPKQRAVEVMKVVCKRNEHMAGCGQFGGSPISRVAKFSFPKAGDPPFTVEITKDVYTLTVKARIEIEARTRGGITWVKPLRVEAYVNGFVSLTPEIGLGIQASKGPSTDLRKKIYEFDYSKNAQPAGALYRGTISIDVGLELAVAAAAELTVRLPVVTRYDGAFAAGWGCRKNYFRDCVSGVEAGIKVVPSIFYTATLASASVSGTAEPYLQVALNSGIRGVDKDLFKVAARAFVQAEVLIEGPTIQVSNEPATLSRVGQKFCLDGQGGASATLYAGGRVFYEVDTTDSPLEKVIKYQYKHIPYEKKFHIASYGWDFAFNTNKPFPKKEGVGINPRPVSDGPRCSGTAVDNAPESRIFKAGEFELSTGSFYVTKNRKFSMQEDGNFVVYEYDPEKNEEGRPKSATGTNGLNYRIIFQRDGNLVIYDLRDRAVWASNTSGLNNATLHLQSDGNLVIYRDNNTAAYATGSQN